MTNEHQQTTPESNLEIPETAERRELADRELKTVVGGLPAVQKTTRGT